MNVLVGDPALRLLARRKLRAAVRSFRRRLRTPKGVFFTLAGVALFGLWMTALFVAAFEDRVAGDPAVLRGNVRFGALMLTMLSLSSSFSHRGLFIPSDEIQRLFAAPVARADLVRYRLRATIGRGLFGAAIVGLVVMQHMPVPLFAFLGALCAVSTLPVLNQLLAILAGALETRWMKRLSSLRTPLLLLCMLGTALAAFALTSGDEDGVLGGIHRRLRPESLVELPVLAALTAPFEPWARMIVAPSAAEFLPWFGLCSGLALFVFELTVRLPVDFRELSLETSASVAARIRRVRRGGGVSSGQASKSLAGLRVPWFFGRGPAGALAWRKASAILRKAKGTLWVSIVVLVVLTVIGRGSESAVPLIAVLGTFYLASGLRFDFRSDLDRMEVIKAWPIAPAKAFGATLVPEVALVAALVMTALCVHGVAVGSFTPAFWAALALQPPFAFAWVAVDNAVFLFAPGADGARPGGSAAERGARRDDDVPARARVGGGRRPLRWAGVPGRVRRRAALRCLGGRPHRGGDRRQLGGAGGL